MYATTSVGVMPSDGFLVVPMGTVKEADRPLVLVLWSVLPVDTPDPAVAFEVTSQGCADVGVCYVPMQTKASVRMEGGASASDIENLIRTIRDRVRERFGIDLNTDHTLEEVGKQFDVTRERIRQIEAKALRKLRHPSRSERLKSFLDQEG